MNSAFYQRIEQALHSERLSVYCHDGADPCLTLARYSMNMSLSEALYPSLQFAEIALRNGVHTALSARLATTEWYDEVTRITEWQSRQIRDAKQSLAEEGKTITPDRIVAELNFGFWTAFFNRFHARSGLGHYLAASVFSHAPDSERDLAKLDARWKKIRDLRNRVFHHERIIHWKDLDEQHARILEIISWISPDLYEMALMLDRYRQIRSAGLEPWMARIRKQWPAA